jgi:nitrite reductase (NADH) small subunit
MTMTESDLIVRLGKGGRDRPTDELMWTTVCASTRLGDDRGVCALVDGAPVAIFRTSYSELFAVGNIDPFSGASVMSRGLLGSFRDRPTVASPMFKQRFDLETGYCIEDADRRLPVYAVREHDGIIEIGLVPAEP